MKKIFLSFPMRNRSDEDIKTTIKGMTRIIKAYFPNEEIEIKDNFDAGYDIDQKLIDSVVHPELLYLSRALFKMADCDYMATIRTEAIWRCEERYNGCEIEEDVARLYNIKIIQLDDRSGEILLPDLYEKVNEMNKRFNEVACDCDGTNINKE